MQKPAIDGLTWKLRTSCPSYGSILSSAATAIQLGREGELPGWMSGPAEIAGRPGLESTRQPMAHDTPREGKDDPAAQAEQIYKNLRNALASVGASLQDLVKTTTYVVSPDCIDAVREARVKYLANDPPTSTLLIVSRLASPEILLEIEAVAYVG